MNFQWSDFGTSNGTKFSHEFTTDQKLVPAQHSIAQHHNFQWHCLDNFKMSYTLPPECKNIHGKGTENGDLTGLQHCKLAFSSKNRFSAGNSK